MPITQRRSLAPAVLVALLGSLLGCRAAPEGSHPAEPDLRVRSIRVPERAFSLANEVLAFEVAGSGAGRARLDLSPLVRRHGAFDEAHVFEFTEASGSRASTATVDGGSVDVSATGGSRLLVYAGLGSRYTNTYGLLCWSREVFLPTGSRIFPEICTRIFCVDEPFLMEELAGDFPGLDELPGFPPGSGPVGGFGGAPGNICDQCDQSWDGIFVPVEECISIDPFDPGYDVEPACHFAGWAPAAPPGCGIPTQEADRSWSDWAEVYSFAAGDDAAALSINLATEIACAGFVALIDAVATYDELVLFPREVFVRGLGSTGAHVVGSPSPPFSSSYVAFKTTTAFENGTTGKRIHTIYARWSLPWGCGSCPDGLLVPVRGNVRDSRQQKLIPLEACTND